MDTADFRKNGKEMVDYICSYIDNIETTYNAIPNVEPGYLKPLLPEEAPEEGEDWDKIMADVETKIMPGMTHWNHPRFHGYFPSGNSYPSMLGDMLSGMSGNMGFSWVSNPACTELEIIVMDWLAKATGLPDHFLSTSSGGGVMQGSASECILVSMIAARVNTIRNLKRKLGCTDPDNCGVSCDCPHDNVHLPRLVAYCTQESHSAVEKNAKIACVNIRILEVDVDGCLQPETLRKAIEKDLADNLIPFFVSVTLGSTGRTSFDDLSLIGPVCKSFPGIWLHVDAAYAGSAFVCPEFRHFLKGIEYADSYNMNASKWLLVSYDCCCLWVKDRKIFTQGFIVDPLFLQHSEEATHTIDYRHWGIPLSRRFRALKLWFVFRCYGIKGLQRYIRNHVALAKIFESFVIKDPKFEVMNTVEMGLVCFRLIGTEGMNQDQNEKLNQDLVDYLHDNLLMFVIPARVNGIFSIRYTVTGEHTTEKDIAKCWSIINDAAEEILKTPKTPTINSPLLRLENIKYKRSPFSSMKTVSKEAFKRFNSRHRLYDGATPMVVSELIDDVTENIKDMLVESINGTEQNAQK